MISATKRHWLIPVVLSGLALFAGQTSHGQAKQSTAPLVLVINGDLWAWTGTDQPLKQLTHWGFNSEPVISPDGKYVAYKSLPQFVVDDIRQNGGRSGYPPSNFWVMNLATGNAERVADQPPGATYGDSGQPEKFTLRPIPAWSPDSNALAWGEILGNKIGSDGSFAGYNENLLVYNLAKKTSQVIVKDMPFTDAITEGDSVDWKSTGLVYLVNPPIGSSEDVPSTVYVYLPDGTQLAKIPISNSDCPCSVAVWVKDGSKEEILVQGDANQALFLLDPATHKKLILSGAVDYWPANAPDSIHVYTTQSGSDNIWHIAVPGQPVVDLGAEDLIAVSPDGQQVAYIPSVQDGILFIYSNGQTTRIAPPPPADTPVSGPVISGMAWQSPLEPQIQH